MADNKIKYVITDGVSKSSEMTQKQALQAYSAIAENERPYYSIVRTDMLYQ